MTRTARHPANFDVADRRVYLVGIGGCGMSGLARLLRSRGAMVAGSDSTASDTTDALTREGIPVAFDQSTASLPEPCDLVIASAAIKPDNPQWLEAERRGIRVMLYAEALGACMLGRTGVAIAGTHGKSTTTAMLGAALVDAGLDPSVIVGATCSQLLGGSLAAPVTPGTGFRLGAPCIPQGSLRERPGILIAEACEFNRSFHNLWPTVACITSVEADHLDVYGSLDAVVQAFHEFAQQLPAERAGGRLLIAHDGAHRREVTAGVEAAVETIGFAPEADWVVRCDPRTREVELAHHAQTLARWMNNLPGQHNAMNAATAAALGIMLGADPARLAASLGAFRGVDRRLQFLGEVRIATAPARHLATRLVPAQTGPATGAGAAPICTGVRVFDDYGHHPTEIDCTLRALRLSERPEQRRGPNGQPGRLVCVFQPHQHSRTRHLLEEFAASFEQADIVIVPHIYFVRDSQAEKAKVSAGDLVDRLRARGVNALHLYPFEAIIEHLQNLCRAGDTLVVMGAGPVFEVGYGYIDAMKRRDQGAAGPSPKAAVGGMDQHGASQRLAPRSPQVGSPASHSGSPPVINIAAQTIEAHG